MASGSGSVTDTACVIPIRLEGSLRAFVALCAITVVLLCESLSNEDCGILILDIALECGDKNTIRPFCQIFITISYLSGCRAWTGRGRKCGTIASGSRRSLGSTMTLLLLWISWLFPLLFHVVTFAYPYFCL